MCYTLFNKDKSQESIMKYFNFESLLEIFIMNNTIF